MACDIAFYTPEGKDAALSLTKRRPHPGHYGLAFKFDINSKTYGQNYGSGTLCWTDLPALNGLNPKQLFELANWINTVPGQLFEGTWKDPELKEYAAMNEKLIAREVQEVEIHNSKIEAHNREVEQKYIEAKREYFVTIATMAGVLKAEELPDKQLENIGKMAVLAGLKVAKIDDWMAVAELPEILSPLEIPTEGDPEAACRGGMAALVHRREVRG